MGCTDCHKIHVNKDPVSNKAAQSDVCYACHKDTRVAANKPSRHPIQEGEDGLLGLPFAARFGRAEARQARHHQRHLLQCHAEKRGPYVHNHQPVQDNCASCHNPHGSHVAGHAGVA